MSKKRELESSLSSQGILRRVADDLFARLSEADEPSAIVEVASTVDLVAALREADDEQRVELFSLMSREQVVGAVDIACWRGDAFSPGALTAFVAPAVGAGIEAAGQVFMSLEKELRTLLLAPYVVVHLREEKNDLFEVPEGSELFECVDGSYAVELPRPDDVPQTIRQILAGLLYRPFEEYQLELECLRHDLPSELEEDALRWRSGRLADMGYATREEGLAALVPMSAEALRARIESAPSAPKTCDEIPLPELFRHSLAGAALLDAALEKMAEAKDPVLAERAALLPAELGAATNLFLSGARCDPGDFEETTRGVRLARDVLALGLEAVSGGDVDSAMRALSRVAPISFVRAGMGVLVPLRERARSLERKLGVAAGGAPLALLDPPHAVVVELLAMEIPRRFRPLDEGGALSPTPLSPLVEEIVGLANLAQTARAEALLAEAEQVPEILARLHALDRENAPLENTPASVAVVTALANAAAGRAPTARPVSAEEAESFSSRAVGMEVEELISQALVALEGSLGIDSEGVRDPEIEPESRRRLVLRLLHLGAARLAGARPCDAIAVAPQSTR